MDSSKLKRLLVTGGSGFIGTHLVDALSQTGAAICNLDIKPPVLESQKAYWTYCDTANIKNVGSIIREFQPTTIINLAAETSLQAGADRFLVNTQGLQALVEGMGGLTGCRLIHFSTQLVFTAGHNPKDERDLRPYGVYGESKAVSERYLWTHGNDIVWTILRPTTVWGPYHPTFSKGIWKYLAKRYYLVPSGRAAIRAYGYVGNVVQQTLRAADLPSHLVDKHTFFVGDESLPSEVWLDAFSVAFTGKKTRRFPFGLLRFFAGAGELLKKTGFPSPIDAGRLERMTTDFPIPMERTLEILGPGSISFDDGIAETVRWYQTGTK